MSQKQGKGFGQMFRQSSFSREKLFSRSVHGPPCLFVSNRFKKPTATTLVFAAAVAKKRRSSCDKGVEPFLAAHLAVTLAMMDARWRLHSD